MNRLCERPGCSAPAEVAYGFDADRLVFWLDALVAVIGTQHGVLCRRHANSMIVPLGWMLDDHREPTLRLFKAPAPEPVPARPRRERRVRDETGEQLRLDAALLDTAPEDAAVVSEAPTPAPPAPPTCEPRVEPEPDPVRPAAVAVVPAESEQPDTDLEPGTNKTADCVETPWVPVFDQEDDLHGLLKARGRLLSRAFNGVPTD